VETVKPNFENHQRTLKLVCIAKIKRKLWKSEIKLTSIALAQFRDLTSLEKRKKIPQQLFSYLKSIKLR
jgi:hypothetical protein